MIDWRRALSDLIAREDADHLSADEAATMRAAILGAVEPDRRPSVRLSWMRPLAFSAAAVALIAVGIVSARRFDAPAPAGGVLSTTPLPPARQSNAAESSSRQLHFLTPGGTRIIWVFNSELNLKATIR
jgi:hypothetical protein